LLRTLPISSSVVTCIFSAYILSRTLLSNTLNLYSSLHVRNEVSHPYGTIGKFIQLCILQFLYL
jgi:hypothetical protein